jgi:hypothetical protein
MDKRKRGKTTNNDLQNITHKTKDWVTNVFSRFRFILIYMYICIYTLILQGWSGLYSNDRFLYLWSIYHENYKTRPRRTGYYRGNTDYVKEGEI